MKYNFCTHNFLYHEDRCIEVSIDISKFSARRQKVAYQTVFAVNVGVITRDIGDSGCRLQIVRDMYQIAWVTALTETTEGMAG